jgi:CheY-like chemotaxis protein
MLEEQAADPEMVEGLAQLRHAAERCAKISRTFLAMARQSAPKRSRASLNALVDSALELTGYSLRSAGIAIEQELDPGVPDVFVEQDQIIQVLMNLIINAQQAMAETAGPRRLTVRTRRGQMAGWVVLTIKDTGPGMDAEVARRIFEPFFTTKPLGQGTGVGLSISHSIVTAHGGTLEVDTQPGAGATLLITLPQADAGASVAAREAPAAGSHNGLSVLVIDDEPDVASTIAEILERDGVRVVTAPDGRAGLELIARQPFDAVLCDLRMPVMDGPQFQRRLQALHPGLAARLVFMSGDLLGAGVTATNGAFGRPLLEKPFAPNDVRAAVTAVVGPR